jgi:hypothetical protein
MARRSTARRTAVTLSCLTALLSIVFCCPAAATAGSPSAEGASAFHILRGTVMAALGNMGATNAVGTLGNSLALLGARYKVERIARAKAAAEPEPETEPAASEEEVDPSTLPPASAGTTSRWACGRAARSSASRPTA